MNRTANHLCGTSHPCPKAEGWLVVAADFWTHLPNFRSALMIAQRGRLTTSCCPSAAVVAAAAVPHEPNCFDLSTH